MRVLNCPICGRSPIVKVLDDTFDAYKMYCKGGGLFPKKMHILVVASSVERCADDWNDAVKNIYEKAATSKDIRAKNKHYSEEN